jgi:LysM repeat protein
MKNRRSRKYKRWFLLITALFICVTIVTIKAQSKTSITYIEYIVSPGDTQWSIAAENNIYSDIREMIFEIRKINNNSDCLIYPGEEIKIPIKNKE